MIKTGGENVASREVEEALYQLDGVAEVAVFGISHPHWIEAVTAVVVPQAGRRRSPREQVDAHAREHLAGYKRPKYVVLADALPKNPSGKILKRELRDRARRPRRGRVTRAGPVATTAGVALFWGLVLVAGALVPGYAARQDYVSSLAGRGSSVAVLGVAAIAVLGLAHLAAAATVRGGPAVPLVLAGLAGLTIAAFRVGCPLDAAGCSFAPGNRIGDAQSGVHGLAVAAYEVALVVAMVAVAVSRRASDRAFALVTAVATPASAVLLLSTGGDANGLWQRAWLLVNTAWLVALVWRTGARRRRR